jgi:DNA-binding IclR family transcriptional regulator
MENTQIRKVTEESGHPGEWAVENVMKIYPGERNAIIFTRVRTKNPLGHSSGGQKILEWSSRKYLEIILRNVLNRVDQGNYRVQKI